MSDASTPATKVSREGIVLIKSFEGFRPRAVQRVEGGWIIGYGHTLSAREGASVSEADAELLLRYDLLPIEKTVNTASPGGLNQHQFDALVSFGFSVGRDRLETSDVLARLTSGATAEAAEAMMAWPATDIPTAGLRRRAAERALFGADPSRPISLADLLMVPVPHVAAEGAPEVASAREPDPVPLLAVEPDAVDATEYEDDAASSEPSDTRIAALAALLGEPEPLVVDADPIVPSFAAAHAYPADPTPVTDLDETPVTAEDEPVQAIPAAEPDAEPIQAMAANDAVASSDPTDPVRAADTTLEPATTAIPYSAGAPEPADVMIASETRADTASVPDLSAMKIQRYAPYATPIVGPLPFWQSPADRDVERATEPAPVAFETATRSEALVLTSPDDTPPAVFARPAWTADEREEAEAIAQPEAGLFGDDLSLTQGGQPLGRPDFEATAPEGFDWSETGAFIIMGAVGLTAFGASMAAFRLASEQGGGDETSIIGWVLAVIGVACVGVSSLNLYRRFGLPGGDR